MSRIVHSSTVAVVTASFALAAGPGVRSAGAELSSGQAVRVADEARVGGVQASCERGEISYVFVDNHAVFDPDEFGEDATFGWAYGLANRVHMTTTRDFILDELLFEEGDCYDPLLLAESERLLRGHPFIARVDVFGLRQPDGTWHVVVDTKDEWTTKLDLRFSLAEGFEFRGASITEENVLGRGVLVGAFIRERDEQRDLGGRFFTPRLLGTRLNASMEAGRTRSGSFFGQEFSYPFVGEVGRLAFRQAFLRRDELFSYSAGSGGPFTHVVLPMEDERIEVTVAGRLGEPGNLTVLGFGVSNETLDFPDFPGDVEVARDGDFGNTETAPEPVVEAVAAQTLHSGATRFNLLFGQRNIRFIQRTGLDALRGVHDVPVGTDLSLTVGRSIGALSTRGDQPEDLYTRAHFFAGTAPKSFTLNGALALEGRRIFSGSEKGKGWRDVIAELDALLYWQPATADAHTFFARIAGAGGWEMGLPFQLTLGGPEGVRGFREEDLPGGRRLLVSIEDRIYVPWPLPEVLDLGFTLFADAGRVWDGDVPFGVDSGWKAAVGGGLRVGFPAETRGVIRVDLATGLGAGGGTIFRVSFTDFVGLTSGFRDGQLQRSRRVNVGPDFFTRNR